MFEPSSLLPKKKPYKAFLARNETAFSRGNENDGDAEASLIRTAPKDSFEILDSLKPHIALKFSYFVFPIYNEFGKNALLHFRNLLVKIHGEHLQDVILSIRKGTCIYIQVFHEKEHIRPKKGEAIITKVEIPKGKELEEYFLEMEGVIKAYAADMREWMQPDTLPEPAS
jgi:hypothetical protein